jgi:hypothetical protein
MALSSELRRKFGAALALAPVLALASCVAVGDLLHGTRDRIVFSHQQHLDANVQSHGKQVEMCAQCHFATPKDIRGEEPGVPLEASCLACHAHATDKSSGSCAKCHTDPADPKTYDIPERPQIHYSHARHNERVERLEQKACDFCHASTWSEGADSGGARVVQDLEGKWHDLCFKCHLMRTEWDRMNCAKCHAAINQRAVASAGVSDTIGPRPLSRFHHGGEWMSRHGDELVGRPDGLALCAKCHDRGYCTDCHDARDERRVRPELKWPDRPDRVFIHRGDYLNRHMLEARLDASYCLRCHATESFCVKCHEKRGLTIGSRASATGGDRFRYEPSGDPGQILQYHNASYTDFVVNPNSPEHHARTARRDIALCASCHDYGSRSVCIDCHADPNVKAPRIAGGNPHPPGFHSAIPMTAKPCSYCHGAGGR